MGAQGTADSVVAAADTVNLSVSAALAAATARDGESGHGGGGGGGGLGGGIFVMEGGSLTISGTLAINGDTVTGGARRKRQ